MLIPTNQNGSLHFMITNFCLEPIGNYYSEKKKLFQRKNFFCPFQSWVGSLEKLVCMTALSFNIGTIFIDKYITHQLYCRSMLGGRSMNVFFENETASDIKTWVSKGERNCLSLIFQLDLQISINFYEKIASHTVPLRNLKQMIDTASKLP